jgi:hypothetical protein
LKREASKQLSGVECWEARLSNQLMVASKEIDKCSVVAGRVLVSRVDCYVGCDRDLMDGEICGREDTSHGSKYQVVGKGREMDVLPTAPQPRKYMRV